MFKNIIVSAANHYKVVLPNGEVVESLIIPDNCHFGRNMQDIIIKILKGLGCELTPHKESGDRGQGFINQNGEYFNRSDAYKIAKSSGQPFNDEYTLPDNKLDSSCIRHFDKSVVLSEICSQPIYCCMRNEMIGECDCENEGIIGYTEGEL